MPVYVLPTKRVVAFLCVLALCGGTLPSSVSLAAPQDGRAASVGRVFDVRDHGAVGDGKTLDTEALQKAIDACAAAGGGQVRFPAGTFLSGTIRLKSNVTLYLDEGAILQGSRYMTEYPPKPIDYVALRYSERSFIYAEKAENIGIEGPGIIDGAGESFIYLSIRDVSSPRGSTSWGRENPRPDYFPFERRPFGVHFVQCRNITVRGITLRNTPMVSQSFLACQNVTIDGVTVRSLNNANVDAIDIISSKDVRITNCDLASSDDALCLKSSSADFTENVVIENCRMTSFSNAFKMGTESNGGFRNITMRNCEMYDSRSSGVSLQIVDGGLMENIDLSDLTFRNVNGGIAIRLGNRARPPGPNQPKPGVGAIRHVRIRNVTATGTGSWKPDTSKGRYYKDPRSPLIGCLISGIPGHDIEDVVLENIKMDFAGGGERKLVDIKVPENEAGYPEYSMFGPLPAYGFYVRHARGITFKDMQLEVRHPDQRPALVFDDVADIKISGFKADTGAETPALIWLKAVKGAVISEPKPNNGLETLVRVDGDKSANIQLAVSGPAAGKQPLVSGPEVPAGAARVTSTR